MNDDSGELDMSTLGEFNGGIDYKIAMDNARNSKFKDVRELAALEDAKMERLNTGKPLEIDEKLDEEKLDKMAYEYYHGDEDAYRRR